MLATPDIELRAVAAVIATDPILAACVLKVANSAFFGRSRTVTSIREAVTRLGTMPLRRVAIAWAVLGVFDRFRTPGFWRHDKFLVHSGATAMLMTDLAESLKSIDLDAAYLVGLLHDIGKLILAVKMPEEYQQVVRRQEVSRRPLTECELEVLGIDHAELSGIAIEKWNLPEAVCCAVRDHHATEDGLDPTAPPSLTLMIAKSDRYINSLGAALLESNFPLVACSHGLAKRKPPHVRSIHFAPPGKVREAFPSNLTRRSGRHAATLPPCEAHNRMVAA